MICLVRAAVHIDVSKAYSSIATHMSIIKVRNGITTFCVTTPCKQLFIAAYLSMVIVRSVATTICVVATQAQFSVAANVAMQIESCSITT